MHPNTLSKKTTLISAKSQTHWQAHVSGHTFPQTHCLSICKRNAHLKNSRHDSMQLDACIHTFIHFNTYIYIYPVAYHHYLLLLLSNHKSLGPIITEDPKIPPSKLTSKWLQRSLAKYRKLRRLPINGCSKWLHPWSLYVEPPHPWSNNLSPHFH